MSFAPVTDPLLEYDEALAAGISPPSSFPIR